MKSSSGHEHNRGGGLQQADGGPSVPGKVGGYASHGKTRKLRDWTSGPRSLSLLSLKAHLPKSSSAACGKGDSRLRTYVPMEFLRPGLWGTGFCTLVQEDGVPRFALSPLIYKPPNIISTLLILFFSPSPLCYISFIFPWGHYFITLPSSPAWPGCCDQQV